MATQITVTGTFVDGDGAVRAGSVEARPTDAFRCTADGIQVNRAWADLGDLDGVGGITALMYATTDGTITPAGVKYDFRITFDDGTVETFRCSVPHDADGGVFNLNQRPSEGDGFPSTDYATIPDVRGIVANALERDSLRTSTYDSFGHSYGKLGVDHEWELYHERVAGMLHADLTNHHISGSCLLDSGVYAGGWVHMCHSVGHPHNNYDEDDYQPQRGAWDLTTGINDINAYAADALLDNAYGDVLRAVVSWLSLGAAWSHYTTAGQSNPAGSWANVNNAFSPGQSPEISYRYSGSSGASWSITTDNAAAGKVVALYFLANKSGGTFAASTITFTVDGVAAEPIGYEGVDFSTDDRLPADCPGNGMMVARFQLDDDDAAHTIVATAGAGGMSYWGYGVEAPRPGVVANVAKPLDAAYTNGADDDLVDTINAVIETVVGEFGAPVVMVDIDTILGKTAAAFDDNIHPGPEEQAQIADAYYLALRSGTPASSRRYL